MVLRVHHALASPDEDHRRRGSTRSPGLLLCHVLTGAARRLMDETWKWLIRR
jgi:hypothetical protein